MLIGFQNLKKKDTDGLSGEVFNKINILSIRPKRRKFR